MKRTLLGFVHTCLCVATCPQKHDHSWLGQSIFGRASCGILIFTVAVSLSHFIVLLVLISLSIKPYILYLYDSNMIKSHLDHVLRGACLFPCAPAAGRLAAPQQFSSFFYKRLKTLWVYWSPKNLGLVVIVRYTENLVFHILDNCPT